MHGNVHDGDSVGTGLCVVGPGLLVVTGAEVVEEGFGVIGLQSTLLGRSQTSVSLLNCRPSGQHS